MHTLFSPSIRSPPLPLNQAPNILGDCVLRSEAAVTPIASAPSSYSSPPNLDLLTRLLQDERRASDDARTIEPKPYMRQHREPKILLMGQRRYLDTQNEAEGGVADDHDYRSGKSSIQNVILQKMPPTETLHLESTTSIQQASMHTFTHLITLELPSHISSSSPEFTTHPSNPTSSSAALWILDIQDDYLASISALATTAIHFARHHPAIKFSVFIHKTDGLSDEYRYDAFREIRQRVQDELADADCVGYDVQFFQTSIFDASIFDAMSRVVQRLLPQLEVLEGLLNKLCAVCGMQKAFLFDRGSKLYVASDASPSVLKDYEVCSDYVDLIVDIKALYGWQTGSSASDSDEESIGESVVTFERSGDTYIYAREIDENVSLICIMVRGSGVEKRVLIDYNVSILQDAVVEVFKV